MELARLDLSIQDYFTTSIKKAHINFFILGQLDCFIELRIR